MLTCHSWHENGGINSILNFIRVVSYVVVHRVLQMTLKRQAAVVQKVLVIDSAGTITLLNGIIFVSTLPPIGLLF